MAQLNLSLPSFQGLDLSDEKQMRKLTSYLYRLDEQLRYVLNNLGEENLSDSLRAIINAQTDATVLDEMTGQVQRLSTQIVQTAQAISLKADKETLDALGETLGQSIAELEVTAEEIRTEVSDTTSGLQSRINQQADEIALRVTKTEYESGLDGKLDADAPSVGVQTASAVVNEKGVYLSGGEIDMRTTDGEDYLNLSSAGVSASSMSAPDVMPRYAGPVVLYVDPNATSEQIDTGAYFRSIQDACNQLNHKFIPAWTCIFLTQTEFYENATLSGCVCPEGIRIAALYNEKHPTIHGTIAFNYCAGYINTRYLKIQPSTDSHGINCYGPGAILVAEYCVMTSGKLMSDSYYGIYANMGARVVLANCEIYNYRYSVCAGRMSSMLLNGGNKGNGSVAASGAIVHMTGSVPSYISGQLSIEKWRGGEVFYSPDNTTWADQGSGGSTPAVPTVNTLSVGVDTAVSYRANGGVWSSDSVIQGWWNGGGRIKGCMWFNNASIRNALSGKTVLTASLRLHMNSSGRGTQVTVELAGTGANYGGGNPAVTKTYGTIATMNPKETQTITIPVQAVNDLVNGTINGLMLYSSDTGSYKERDYSKNYAAFAGYGDDATEPLLTITYS